MICFSRKFGMVGVGVVVFEVVVFVVVFVVVICGGCRLSRC